MEYGWLYFWHQADWVARSVAIILLSMSVISWTIVLKRGLEYSLLKKNRVKALADFWAQHYYDDAIHALDQSAGVDPYQIMAKIAGRVKTDSACQTDQKSLASMVSMDDRVTRTVRYGLARATIRLERGLSFLATTGSSAPFIGLFGTVWGILHALKGIATGGAVQLDKIAGPISEALVMTAFGLAVAIPALMFYNTFVRMNRVLLVDLDGFAHDLHRYFCEKLSEEQQGKEDQKESS